MAIKKRTKSINDLRKQMESIGGRLRASNSPSEVRMQRYTRATAAYNRYTRNIRNTAEGKAVREQNFKDNNALSYMTKKSSAKAAQALIARNNEMNKNFERKQFSYSTRMGITG